jgi:PAS domain S-box-containing protein
MSDAEFPKGDVYRLIVEQTRDYALFALDARGVIQTWNAGAERLKGYRPDEIIGSHFSRFYAQEDIARRWPERELEMASAEGRFEDEGWRVRKDGSRFWANVVITALRDRDGRLVGFSKITRDLTGRRMHEEALRESEERFRLLVEGVTDYAIYMLDPDGLITSWNGGAERITGYARDEIVGSHFSRFYADEDKATAPWEQLATARRLGRAESEGWRVRKNGERFWARVVVTALYDAHRLRGFAKITQDLSDRRHIQALEQAARNVGDFIAVLAHELRNPLAPIRTSVELLSRLPREHPSHDALHAVLVRQTDQLTRIVDDLLDMARITRGVLSIRHANVDMSDVLQRALETIRPQVQEQGHELVVDERDAGLVVSGDAHRLTQVLVNLLGNAARYTPRGGRIEVAVAGVQGYATLTVRDNGRGIEPAMIDRIFDMFVRGRDTTVDAGGGLGVGLALSRKIAELHGGSLEAASGGRGEGAEFTLKLPLVRDASVMVSPPVRDLPRTAAQRILLVDDNADAAAALDMLLKEMGHHTEVVHGGRQALEKIASFAPDCVFLDLGMPDLDGYEVARRVRAGTTRQPWLIALTGWGQDSDRDKTRAAGFDAHLVKPVATEDIARTLASVSGARVLSRVG